MPTPVVHYKRRCQMGSTENSEKPSKGIGFAVAALIVMIVELAILADIDSEFRSETIVIFFTGLGVLCLLQVVGIVLVVRGFYRLGGIFQIVASLVHILDGFGILGVMGGVIAMRYGDGLKVSTHKD